MEPFRIIPVGIVKKTDTTVSIEIYDDYLSLIHISEPTRQVLVSRMPSSA